jgi:acyl carrier protein
VVTTGSADVSGNDPLNPASAAAHGVLRTLLAESPGLRGAVIDVGDRVPVAELSAELRLAEPDPAVALRGHRRWVPVEREFDVPAADADAGVVRDRGGYLITGGFGGLGLAVARGLAATGRRPRLALLGRRDPGPTALAEIAELRALGAEVLPIACDVRDAGATRAAVAEAVAAFGPLSGVFHLAGVPGGQMIAFREPADAAAILAPKTAGTVNLLEALRPGPAPDFVVLFSSRAAVDGLVGGADYAAANGFLDAVAQASTAPGRVLSIGWPVWLGAGMAGADGADLTGLADRVAGLDRGDSAGPASLTWEGEFGARTHWVLDEHRVDRQPIMPGTGMIDLVVGLFTGKLAEPDTAVELTDVVFRTPFGSDRPSTLRVVFTPAGEGHEFEVSSEQGTHTTGRVASVPWAAASADVDEVRARLTAAGAAGASVAGNRPFTFGPRWRNISRAWRVGDETLVRLELMAAFADDLDEHRVHPALLDTATAAVCGPDDGALVPFLYRRIVLHRDLPGVFYSHIHRRNSGSGTVAADLRLIAEDGSVVAVVEGFTMRRAEFADAAGEGFGKLAPPRQRSEPEPADQGGKTGLTTQEGVRLLMRLLAGRTPPSVLVRHHRDGRPVSPALPAGPTPPRAVPIPAPPAGPAQPPARTPVVSTVDDLVPVATRDRLRGLWEQTLGDEPEHDGVDFFDVGGDSLAAVELMAKIRSAFGIELSIGLLLDARTFGALLGLVEEQYSDS